LNNFPVSGLKGENLLTTKTMDRKSQPTHGNGKICYIEIPAADISESASFYTAVFGWETRNRSDGHLAFDDAIGEVSGTWVKDRKPTTEAGLLIYIMVDDIHLAVEQVKSNGGIIVQPVGMDAPELTARFRDPAGNILGLYQEPLHG
jgi:predicted enzyme related to lactoylglutathione lyase